MAAISTVYDIKVNYITTGDAPRKTAAFAGTLGKIARGLGKVSTLSVAALGIGAAVAIGKTVAAGFQYNKFLEDTKISMAGLINLNTNFGAAKSWKQAGALVKAFEKDAIKSTATTKEFVDFSSRITGPITNAGGSMADLRDITKGAVPIAKAMGISSEQAALDIQQALNGTLGAKDRFAKALGILPAEFNKLVKENPSAALEKLKTVFQNPALQDMAERQAKSFSGVTSTLTDFFERFAAGTAAPLFERITKLLGTISEFFVSNADAIMFYATSIGDILGNIFDVGSDVVGLVFDSLGGFSGIFNKALDITELIVNAFNFITTSTANTFIIIGRFFSNTVDAVVNKMIDFVNDLTTVIPFLDPTNIKPLTEKSTFADTIKDPVVFDIRKEIEKFTKRNAAEDLSTERSKSKLSGKPTNNVNVTISRIEVASDDPDRFAFNLVNAFEDTINNPTQAASALSEL